MQNQVLVICELAAMSTISKSMVYWRWLPLFVDLLLLTSSAPWLQTPDRIAARPARSGNGDLSASEYAATVEAAVGTGLAFRSSQDSDGDASVCLPYHQTIIAASNLSSVIFF